MSSLPVSLLVLLAAASVNCGVRPPYIGCQTSAECGKNACCVIGMGRYTIPKCQLLRDLGDGCRPYGEPTNTTLHYPDGTSVDLSEIYYIHCPCLEGLTCADSEDTPACVETSMTNQLFNQDYSDEY